MAGEMIPRHGTQCLIPGGAAYIATKTMYFGLDGGSLPFRCTSRVHAILCFFAEQRVNCWCRCRSLVQQAGGATVRQVAAVTDGIAREVLEVQMTPAAA